MHLLVSNQASSNAETFLFFGIFYIQLLSGFFSNYIGVLEIEGSKFDKILNYFEKIFRVKDLFGNNYTEFRVFFYLFVILFVIFTIFFIILCSQTKMTSFYSLKHKIMNYVIKGFIYIFYTIILDFCLSNICFEKDSKDNPHFSNVSCQTSDKIPIIVLSVIVFMYASFINFFLQFFYIDSLYLSSSPYAKLSCNYEIFLGINTMLYSIFYIEAKYFSKGVFLLYNLASSVFFFWFYVKRCIFYNYKTNVLGGIFHTLYVWTSLFFFLFSFFHFKEKSIIYVLTSAVVVFLYFNIKNRLEDGILLTTPYYKIINPFHLLYYIKNIINKINLMEKDPDEKALLTGILQMHAIECPNPTCLSKTKNKIYLPITNEWSDRTKPVINDKVYLLNFVIVIMNYFINQNYYSPEMIINISLYYLEIIGNYCKSLYFFQKVKKMKLTYQEFFSYSRLKITIMKRLVSKFKMSNEPCMNLEELDVTYYFRYTDLSQNLYEEMSNDVYYSLEFWKNFKKSQVDSNKVIDFNHVFHLTDKIRITKEKVEEIWKKCFNIFNGVNDLFDLYLIYTEQVNDDDLLKRNLEEIKRKSENSADFIQQNFYSVLFNKDTGILIANGDKGKEGVIEKVNKEIESIFKFKAEEIKGLNLNELMPKSIGKEHVEFMKNYYEIGDKKILDKKDRKVIGKDKDNCIIFLRIAVKLFPVLNENVLFVALLSKENIDDMIVLDSKFNIQGMSSKLTRILQIEDKTLFTENEIPFYLICKKFVNFFKIFLSKHKKKKKNKPKSRESKYQTDEIGASDIFGGSMNFSKFAGAFNKNETSQMPNKLMKTLETGSHIKESELTNTNLSVSKKEENEDDDDSNPSNRGKDAGNKVDNENIEISENIELEYEIKIPKYIYDFASYQNKKDKSLETKQFMDYEEEPVENVINESCDESNESELLVDSDKRGKENNLGIPIRPIPRLSVSFSNGGALKGTNILSIYNKDLKKINSPSLSQKTLGTINSMTTPYIQQGNGPYSKNIMQISSSNNIMNVFNKQSEEEMQFGRKILKGRLLFDNLQFNELEDFIDTSNKDSPMNEFKFNFTFDRFKFGKVLTYVVRCIDNKNDIGKSDNGSLAEDYDLGMTKFKKEKNESLQDKFELLEKERNFITDTYQNFITLSLENSEFRKVLEISKERISKMSAIHGHKKEELIDDENSSQTSQSGFNNELCKKNHIEEIRSNLMNKVNHFYTLKYIQIIVALIFVVTCVFINLFCISIKNIRDDMLTVSGMNIDIFETTFYISTLVSTLVSLRALVYFKINNLPYHFETFFPTEQEYYEGMKEIAAKFYNLSIVYFGTMEQKINKYIDNSKAKFWDREPISYNFPQLEDTESFPLGVNQLLANVNSLLKNQYFTIDRTIIQNMAQNKQKFIDYISFFSIENFYDNLFPSQLTKIKMIPEELKRYNNNCLKIVIIIIATYFIISFILNSIYGLLLYTTNKNMGEGLEKVSKISLEKIEDTIKKIEGFSHVLQRYKNKEVITPSFEEKQTPNETKISPGSSVEKNLNIKKIANTSSADSSEPKHHKKLKMLTYSYFQLPVLVIIQCTFLIPLLMLAVHMIKSTNKLIDIQSYIFGKFIKTAAHTIKVKCMMSQCYITKELEYEDLVNISQISYIVQSISTFPEINYFYNNFFLLDACGAAFDPQNQTELYNKCLNDSLVMSTNNTDSLLKLVEEYKDNIYKDKELQMGANQSTFSTLMLFNTTSFKELESIYYQYITPVSNKWGKYFVLGLTNYLHSNMTITWVLNALLALGIVILCIYLGIFFVNQLIHLLSVSRCILKIIPTNVISSTQDLEDWIENRR